MDFYSQQDQTKKRTRQLLVLFFVAMAAVVLLMNIAVSLVLFTNDFEWDWTVFWSVTVFVLAIIGLAILYKWNELRSGGAKIAESLGGTPLYPDTMDKKERILLNVVEEMAIASGITMPEVYILKKERGINAFAAGYSPADAVIGVTRGCLKQLNREQLQGVIAHEFSHILNGDMKLNMRMIILLYGIDFLGSSVFNLIYLGDDNESYSNEDSSSSFSGGRIIILIILLKVIGSIGVCFGNMIKASVCRQREFLADASAVQFTRNPNGLADALKIIGDYSRRGNVIYSSAHEAGHMFICNPIAESAWSFSIPTHPPLKERIKAIEPSWDGKTIPRKIAAYEEKELADEAALNQNNKGQKSVSIEKRNLAMAAFSSILLGQGVETLAGKYAFLAKIKDPLTASAVICTVLLDKNESIRELQLKTINEQAAKGTGLLVDKLYPQLNGVDPEVRMVLCEHSIAILRQMSESQFDQFMRVIKSLVRADNKIDLFEWCMYQTITHYLGRKFNRNEEASVSYKNINQVADEYDIILSTLIHNGHSDPETAERAFNRAASNSGSYRATLLDRSDCTIEEFNRAVDKIKGCSPMLKRKILSGLMRGATFDGRVDPTEKEIIVALSAVWNCPIPRVQK